MMRRAGFLAGLALCALAPARGYYPFVHYLNSGGADVVAPDKFDLTQLPAKTVSMFVSDAGPGSIQFGPNDSFNSVLSQIRQAAQVWNAVASSDLRVAFGGLETSGTPQNTPGVDIVFEDQVPGVLAYTSHFAPAQTSGPAGPFYAITRSTIHLARDLTQSPGPSSSELFFTTVVHEMGHALGLQHTFTASAMSTYLFGRATSRVQPLERDDIVGLSLLYPRNGFPGGLGSISGRVTSGGQGVHLASVVALRPDGSAVSTLTGRDGSYRIDGLPPNTYWVYVHPLPPDANVTDPLDANGQPVPPSGPTETLFYAGPGRPGTREFTQFASIGVSANAVTSGIDFSVQPRAAVALYDISIWSYFGQNPVTPAYLDTASPAPLAVTGVGVMSGTDPLPGLQAQVLGGIGTVGVRGYGYTTAFAMDVPLSPFIGLGPRHLLFSTPTDLYVLPSGLQLVNRLPAQVASVTSNADGTVTVVGSGMGPDSVVYFDGFPAAVRAPFSGDANAGTIGVQPPPGAGGQQSTVTVVNSDGQESAFLQSAAPVLYSYPAANPPAFVITPASLPAGTASMVDVQGSNVDFSGGAVALGFGSSDVAVRRVWVLGPNHFIANVVVSPNAAVGVSETSVMAGFQYAAQPSGFQIQAANPQLPALALPLINPIPGQTTFYPGGYVSLFGSNLSTGPNTTSVTLNGQAAPLLYAASGQINIQVPAGFPTGPATLQVNNGQALAAPVVIEIDTAPPTLVSASETSAAAGDTITLLLANLDPTVLAAPSRLSVTEGGQSVPAGAITAVPGQSNQFQVTVTLATGISGAQVPLFVTVDGNNSNTILIAVH